MLSQHIFPLAVSREAETTTVVVCRHQFPPLAPLSPLACLAGIETRGVWEGERRNNNWSENIGRQSMGGLLARKRKQSIAMGYTGRRLLVSWGMKKRARTIICYPASSSSFLCFPSCVSALSFSLYSFTLSNGCVRLCFLSIIRQSEVYDWLVDVESCSQCIINLLYVRPILRANSNLWNESQLCSIFQSQNNLVF